ncbi:sugar phosphate isomerase/epimerase family protein [Paenibacillus aurantius]|uniref:Sugar phosphate isomerase/epimerase family protein n=1 Tax=Paenibacillus aurantius TaxID=2918900 RepID=A0AA96LL07_9BACL|nr:sugar phosphate isomerase/epimerase family protein [Paenibacillus aurantius]WNQ13322.1 sugar phosphate isomerase/epimerase family protein [Paenibacillus aurantius]
MLNKGTYSFSTCWNIRRHTAGRGMVEEIKELGFQYVELNYNVTDELLATIEPMIEKGEIGVSSVHNVFPHVPDKDYDTDSVMLGFDDEDKRKRAVELLIRSMEYADRYGAKAVVVHPGEVPFDTNIDAELKQIYREKGKESAEYRSLWDAMLERRERLSPHYRRRIEESLHTAAEYAAKRNWKVVLGIETRSRCYQMPTLMEAKAICDSLSGSGVGLWFDIGHAMMMERMGLYDNPSEIELVKPYVYGVHIHETLELSDHWCPYVHSGTDRCFDLFLPIIDQAEVKVYELKAVCAPEEIHESHALLIKKLETMPKEEAE